MITRASRNNEHNINKHALNTSEPLPPTTRAQSIRCIIRNMMRDVTHTKLIEKQLALHRIARSDVNVNVIARLYKQH